MITVFLFGIMENRSKIKDVYTYAKNHLSERFPKLPSYTGFVQRLNRLGSLFTALTERILNDFEDNDMMRHVRLTDSLPIVMADAERSSGAKVASEFADKGFCASEGIRYYGVKIHISGIRRHKTLPLPGYIGVTPASDHDLTAFRYFPPGSAESVSLLSLYSIGFRKRAIFRPVQKYAHITV